MWQNSNTQKFYGIAGPPVLNNYRNCFNSNKVLSVYYCSKLNLTKFQVWLLCSCAIMRLKADIPVYYAPYVQQPGIAHSVWYKSAPWLCQTMKTLLMFCFQSPIFWMFIEGIYLHSRVSTHIFHQVPPFRIYYFIGWGTKSDWKLVNIVLFVFAGLPLIVTLIWVGAMELTTNTSEEDGCWEDYSSNNSIFIIVIPMISILLASSYTF